VRNKLFSLINANLKIVSQEQFNLLINLTNKSRKKFISNFILKIFKKGKKREKKGKKRGQGKKGNFLLKKREISLKKGNVATLV
jgi:hypothetical protein